MTNDKINNFYQKVKDNISRCFRNTRIWHSCNMDKLKSWHENNMNCAKIWHNHNMTEIKKFFNITNNHNIHKEDINEYDINE